MKNNSFLYKWLIVTFIVLYAATAFISFYHSITFFNIANAVWMSIVLSLVAEIGQASVLFSLLLTKNKHSTLAWSIMFLLTGLQIVGNVVSSYDWIINHDGGGVESFRQSILFSVTAIDPQLFKVVIAWITGGILPIIALSMTALVADNMKLNEEEHDTEDSTDLNEQSEIDPLRPEFEPASQNETELGVKIDSDHSDLAPTQKKKRIRKKPVSKKSSNINVKSGKVNTVKNLDSIKKISRGSELIKEIQNDELNSDKVIPISPTLSDQTTSNTQSEGAKSPPGPGNILSTTYDKSGNIIDKNF